MIVWRAAILAALVMTGRPAIAQDAPLPSSSLSVRVGGEWREFWNAARPTIVSRDTALLVAMRWQKGAAGMLWGELELRGDGEAWRTRLIVARVDPQKVRFRLDTAFAPNRTSAAWTLAKAPKNALLAVNAGQFAATMPWGWVVLDGRRWLPPQHGPLSAALLQDSSGILRWATGDSVSRYAGSTTGVRWAFQSYPAVMARDSVLPQLRNGASGVSVTHRDARAGICLARDGRLLVALTRFDGVGRVLHFVPLGLTAPEMAGVLAALGCRDAMLLDGGISARLRIRDGAGLDHDWDGLRAVPLALLAVPR